MARYVGESNLANDGSVTLVTPAYTMVDVAASLRIRSQMVRLQVQNLMNEVAYSGGYTDGTVRYLFPVATRTFMASVVYTF